MNQLKIPLYQALVEHMRNKKASFHVPGHKDGDIFGPMKDIYQPILKLDATELTGLDDLHSPEGVILEAEDLLADLYKVRKSFFLVNGSTVGNLAMIMTTCSENDIVLVQRNCHKSIMNALKLVKAKPVFLEPEPDAQWKAATGPSRATVVKAIRKYPAAKALILTYPNYYGMVYDLESLIKVAHEHKIPVLVDEAHGPHFILGEPFPPSALKLGADIAVQSAHKTLPAMTMGSFLHINSDLVNMDTLKEYLNMLQSSSPSYPIMASLDIARNYLAAYKKEDMEFLLGEANYFKGLLNDIPGIQVLEYPGKIGDPLKVTIQSSSSLSGYQMQRKFEEKGIFTELADPFNVLFILPLLKVNHYYPLKESAMAMKAVLDGYGNENSRPGKTLQGEKISELALSYKEMAGCEEKMVHVSKAEGLVCAETIIPYPPGIPLLIKGERVTMEKTSCLKELIESGARFQGGAALEEGLIKVFNHL